MITLFPVVARSLLRAVYLLIAGGERAKLV